MLTCSAFFSASENAMAASNKIRLRAFAEEGKRGAKTALRLTDAPALEQVELLPYHVTAGAKYAMVGRQYRPEFDTAAAPNLNTGIFLAHGIACTHL